MWAIRLAPLHSDMSAHIFCSLFFWRWCIWMIWRDVPSRPRQNVARTSRQSRALVSTAHQTSRPSHAGRSVCLGGTLHALSHEGKKKPRKLPFLRPPPFNDAPSAGRGHDTEWHSWLELPNCHFVSSLPTYGGGSCSDVWRSPNRHLSAHPAHNAPTDAAAANKRSSLNISASFNQGDREDRERERERERESGWGKEIKDIIMGLSELEQNVSSFYLWSDYMSLCFHSSVFFKVQLSAYLFTPSEYKTMDSDWMVYQLDIWFYVLKPSPKRFFL